MEKGKIHCVGIGGIGLSALAQWYKAEGYDVSGCDRGASPVTERLEALHIPIAIGHGADHVSEDLGILVYSDAVLESVPERVRARELGIPQMSYAEALGEIANHSKCLIAVAGAHGKTSTTAMLIDVLEAGELNPTAVVGSLRAKTKSNFRAGGAEHFIVEADEYMRHFLQFTPQILVITNIDEDHLDYYKDLADIQSAFRALAKRVPADGFVVCDPHDPKVAPILGDLPCTVVDYRTYFDPHLPMKALPLQRINAAVALAVADILTIDSATAKKALLQFSGTWRRFEYKGRAPSGALVYDDYGHHPKEISLTLASVREVYPDRKIIVAFQPHLYSRTKLLLDDFAAAFIDADEVFLAPIFAAREEADPDISSELLAQKINERGTVAYVYGSLDRLRSALQAASSNLQAGDVVITMGAGELYKVAEELTK